MNRRSMIVTTVALSAIAASGQPSRAEPFSLKQEYVATTLNGQSFDDRSRKLTLFHNDRSGHHIYAYAGCNHLSLAVTFLGGGHYTFRNGAQTQMGCGARNNTEKEYFDAVMRTKHWRISEEKLILEGDKDILQFEAAEKKEAMQ